MSEEGKIWLCVGKIHWVLALVKGPPPTCPYAPPCPRVVKSSQLALQKTLGSGGPQVDG